MGLSQYKKKRKFNETPEPEGKKKGKAGKLIFVIQKHAASHLHYDFRLEMEGVLKSWAVPKGPSLNPEDKRLAMMVEDHPYDYKDFEGNIPEGNYGAGNVIVWDNGTYHALGVEEDDPKNEKLLLAGLHKGNLKIVLKGKKLKGEFALVKMHNGKQENAWLLIKHNDRYASDEDITEKNRSVISRVTLEKLEAQNDKKAPAKKAAKKAAPAKKVKAAKPGVKKKPEAVKPMLATLGKSPFDDPDWIFEMKFDGYRALAACDGKGEVELYSRNLQPFNKLFAPVAKALEQITHPCLIDGEVVVENEEGRSDFQLLQNYQNTGSGNLKYYVFDLLSLDGKDLTELPLLDRKKLLEMLIGNEQPEGVIYSSHVQETGKRFYEVALEHQLEGIIAKDAHSPYRVDKRTADWLKIKIVNEQEAVIAGITEPKGSRDHFGSLLLGAYENGELQYIGNCGSGFTQDTLKDLYKRFQPLFTDRSPFKKRIKGIGKVQWLKPRLVCQVKFTEWTGDAHMRHPVYLGLRIDKKPRDVVKESTSNMKPKSTDKPADKAGKDDKPEEGDSMKVGQTTVKLTNQDKLYWPEDKITKGDLIDYYSDVADIMLPYLKDRPQSMHRFPSGIHGQSFFQKDVDRELTPLWVRTEIIYSESNEEHIDYLVCDDKATLLYMANLGCIEINPWNSRAKHLEYPDWMVIDLDPEEISFKEVVKAALATKKVLDDLGIESYCKTSGATGLHVFVPLAAEYDYEVVKHFAHLVASYVHKLLPATTSLERSPSKRKRKVYLDFLQNRKGQTLAAPYSVRPRPGATVSTPLEWKEVNARLDPARFTIKTMRKRIDAKGDLWAPVIGKGADIEQAISRITKMEEEPETQVKVQRKK